MPEGRQASCSSPYPFWREMSLTPAIPASGAKGASAIRLGVGIALPHEADLESCGSDTLCPQPLQGRFRRQIGDIGGNRFESSFERTGQTAECDLRVKRLMHRRRVDKTDLRAGREETVQSRGADK